MNTSRLLALFAFGLVAVLPFRPTAANDAPKFTPAQVSHYETEVLPILKAHCLKCHGAEAKVKGGLNLSTRAAALEGGDTGPALDAKNPAASLFLKAIDFKTEGMQMPPKGKLPEKELAVLTKWVKDGMPYPADKLGGADIAKKEGVVTEEAKKYWAYQPVKRPAVPPGANAIDAFIAAKRDDKGLKPVAPASKVALVRRAYYDLHGLPPTPEQIDAFVNDKSPAAWERLIDTLLASPHYGEKWGRHWLDVVRYAETNGYERDGPKPYAWRYRDYVIKSFNDDKPYDTFVKEQLAGDEMPAHSPDAVIATGFYRLGIWDDEPADPQQALYDGYDDIVATAGQGFLGMTFNCARCHDHKVDPIPQTDYYKLVAFFRDIRPYSENRDVRSSNNLTDITPPEKRKTYEDELKKRTARVEEITKAMTAIEDAAIKKMPAEDQRASEGIDRPQVVAKVPKFLADKEKAEYEGLKKEKAGLTRRGSPAGQELALSVNNCYTKVPPVHLLVRGSPHAKGKEVQPGFPAVLGLPDPTISPPPAGVKSSGRRTVLANWIADAKNPMTARVFVNRVWQGHFGRGLVPSTNDFGKLGDKPTHPELLDWLASEFTEGGRGAQGEPAGGSPSNGAWKVKRLHKLIMMSATYQLASTGDAENLKADPANALYWRFNMRRLNAEEVRDSILAASGSLNLKAGGPSVYPKIPKEVLAGQSVPGQGWPTSTADEGNRRSVYVHIKRSLQVPILVQHDQADTDSSCPVRYTTTVPTQALGLLNGEFANEQAMAFARRLMKDEPGDLKARVARGIRLTTGRVPTPEEVAKDAAFIAEMRKTHVQDDTKALAQYALLLLNANEFVYLD